MNLVKEITFEQIKKEIDFRELNDHKKFVEFFNQEVLPYFEPAMNSGAVKPTEILSQQWIGLAILYLYRGCLIHKQTIAEIIKYISKLDKTPDYQGRHLAKQCGFNIKIRGEDHNGIKIKSGFYLLVDGNVSPRFSKDARSQCINRNDFNELKKIYDNSCALCRQKEETISPFDKKIIKLEKGHMDPRKPANNDNIIPLCEYHNKYYSTTGKQPIYKDDGQIKEFIDI